MKKMYLEVEVEQNHGNWVDVFYRKNKYYTCSKDDAELVEIEDAEDKGVERLAEAIKFIIARNSYSDGSKEVREIFDGYCSCPNIISNFSPKEIIKRAEKMRQRVPTVGDIYVSRESGNKVAVLFYNEEACQVRFMGRSYITTYPVKDFNKMFLFTGYNYQSIDNIVNKLYSEEGDNT